VLTDAAIHVAKEAVDRIKQGFQKENFKMIKINNGQDRDAFLEGVGRAYAPRGDLCRHPKDAQNELHADIMVCNRQLYICMKTLLKYTHTRGDVSVFWHPTKTQVRIPCMALLDRSLQLRS